MKKRAARFWTPSQGLARLERCCPGIPGPGRKTSSFSEHLSLHLLISPPVLSVYVISSDHMPELELFARSQYVSSCRIIGPFMGGSLTHSSRTGETSSFKQALVCSNQPPHMAARMKPSWHSSFICKPAPTNLRVDHITHKCRGPLLLQYKCRCADYQTVPVGKTCSGSGSQKMS